MTFDGFLEGATLLISDDNEINRTVFGQQVEVTRANVVFAENAMPIMGGLEAARKIRKIERKANQPASIILAVSENFLPKS
jgi:CheY-like chemotaxis protein